nr:MAG TPA: hypothetical protein [Caudoviricetes sp.]
MDSFNCDHLVIILDVVSSKWFTLGCCFSLGLTIGGACDT